MEEFYGSKELKNSAMWKEEPECIATKTLSFANFRDRNLAVLFIFNPTYFIYENLKQTAEKKISNCAVVIILRSSLSDHALQC